MTALGFYIIFCLTTAIVTVYDILLPVVRDMIADNKNVAIAKNPLLYMIVFLSSILLAPILFFILLIPSWNSKYRAGLYNGLTQVDQ